MFSSWKKKASMGQTRNSPEQKTYYVYTNKSCVWLQVSRSYGALKTSWRDGVPCMTCVFFTSKRPSRDPFSPGRLLQTHSSQCQWVKHRLRLRVFGLLAVLGGSERLHVKACVYLSSFWLHLGNTRSWRVEHKPPESRTTNHSFIHFLEVGYQPHTPKKKSLTPALVNKHSDSGVVFHHASVTHISLANQNNLGELQVWKCSTTSGHWKKKWTHRHIASLVSSR